MTAYLVRRFLLMLLTLFGISVIIFALLRIVPGNIVDILADAAGFVNPAEKLRLEAELGLDKPIPVQYANWIAGLAKGDPHILRFIESLSPVQRLLTKMATHDFTLVAAQLEVPHIKGLRQFR